MTPISDPIARERLEAAARRKDHARRRRVLVVTVASVGTVLLACAALDYAFTLPRAARWAGLGLWLATAAWGALRISRLRHAPTRVEEAAQDAETLRPDLGCEVSTAAEYVSGARTPTREYEPEIAAALQQRASLHLAAVQVPYARTLVRPVLWGAAAVAAAIVAFALFAPGGFISLLRATVPWSNASHTRIQPSLGNVELATGTRITLTNQLGGRIPREARFEFREDGSNTWQSVVLPVSQGAALHPITVSKSMDWRVAAGDAVTPEFRLEAYTPAAVRALAIRITPPAYTRLPAVEQRSPAITTLRGSRTLFRLDPNVPLSTAALRFTNGVVLPLTRVTNDLWSAELTVTHDNAYSFVLADSRGRPGLDRSLHRVRALPDEPPKIEITQPGQDIRANPTNTVPLRIEASDDFGIASSRLVFHKLGQPEREVALDVSAFKDGKLTTAAEIALAPLQLREYELVAYHAEARDNNDFDGPGIGRSATYFIEVTDQVSQPSPKAQSQGKSEKVNLLAIQKQIVADTAAAPDAPAAKSRELAQRQRDALEFARMYQTSLAQNGAPIEAQGLMNAAVESMEKAASTLDQAQTRQAVPPEEAALAALYQTVRAMPQLANLPTRPQRPQAQQPPPPPSVRVVLEEIQKKKDPEADQKEIEAALAELEKMAEAQAELASAAEAAANTESEAERETPPGNDRNEGSGQDPSQSPSKSQASQPAQAAAPAKGKGKGKGQGEGQGQGEGTPKDPADPADPSDPSDPSKPNAQEQANAKPGEAKPAQGKGPAKDLSDQTDPSDPTDPSPPSTLPQLAPKQDALSQRALELAERLNRTLTQGQRAGQNPGDGLRKTAQQMRQAAQAMRSSNAGAANAAGANSGAGIQSAIATLERMLEGRASLSDVSAEEAPSRYEGPISDYFRRLSRAE